MKFLSSRTLPGSLAAALYLALVAGTLAAPRSEPALDLACPSGSRVVPVGDELREMTGETQTVGGVVCSTPPKVPEPVDEVMAAEAHRAAIVSAPTGRVSKTRSQTP